MRHHGPGRPSSARHSAAAAAARRHGAQTPDTAPITATTATPSPPTAELASTAVRVPDARPQAAFRFQPLERRVERPARHLAAGLGLDLLEDGDRVRLVAEPQDRQQNNLFELAEVDVRRHMPAL